MLFLRDGNTSVPFIQTLNFKTMKNKKISSFCTGRLEVGPGSLGDANAGVSGGGTGDTSVRFWSGDVYANRESAPYRVLQNGALYSTLGQIAGWTIAADGIFTGTKKTSDGYSVSGITIASNGSIHSLRFYINSDGSIGIRSATSGKRIEISSTNNNVKLYDSSGNEKIRIDDNIGVSGNVPGITIKAAGSYNDYLDLAGAFLGLYNSDNSPVFEVYNQSGSIYIRLIGLPTGGSNLKSVYVDTNTGQLFRAS
jgi:hypothetical protein